MRNTEISENSLKNLIPFEPGTSGNLKGRPVGRKTGLRARLLQELDKMADPDIVAILEAKGIKLDNGDCAEVIAKSLTRKSQKGDVAAAKLIAEQTELPHPKNINLTADFTVHIESKDADML